MRRRITIGKEGPGQIAARLPRELINYVVKRAIKSGRTYSAEVRQIIAERRHMGDEKVETKGRV